MFIKKCNKSNRHPLKGTLKVAVGLALINYLPLCQASWKQTRSDNDRRINQYNQVDDDIDLRDASERGDMSILPSIHTYRPLGAQELLDRGLTYQNRNEFHKAIQAYDEALSIPGIEDSIKAKVLNNRGNAKNALGLFKQAIQDFDTVLYMHGIEDDTKAKALNNRGNAKNGLNRIQAAMQDYNAALAVPGIRADTKASAHVNRGIIKYQLNNFPQALEDFDDALAISEIDEVTRAKALGGRGLTRVQLGQWEHAVVDLEEALKNKSVFTKERLALFYKELRKAYKALSKK